MSLLRSKLRGVIHLSSTTENLPDVEFEGGEGPEQIMDQIQSFAVPLIRKDIDPVGHCLKWEELDIERGELRRNKQPLEDRLEFELRSDDQGIELLLRDAGAPDPNRVWVPLRLLAEPGHRELASLGWTVKRPRFYWRYVEISQTPRLELSWHCDEIYKGWADLLRQRYPAIPCRVDDSRECRLNLRRGGPLFYRGHLQLPDTWFPSRRWIRLRQPFVIVEADQEPDSSVINDDIVMTAEALDFRAVLADRTTRLISDVDLSQDFEAEVLTPEEILLPGEITGGQIPGIPWTVAVESVASATGSAIHTSSQESGPMGENDLGSSPAMARHRRWRLRPLSEESGEWGQVDWGQQGCLRFAMGAPDVEEATTTDVPEITRIDNRRATVGWRIEISAEEPDELLCFTIPHWVPMEGHEHVALPYRGHGFDYAAEVRAALNGLEERFGIDPSSEMSANRLFLDPRRWRFHDEIRGDVQDAEALGEVSGYVRWRRPADDMDGEAPFRGRRVSPTDWARGQAPVLLIRRPEGSGRREQNVGHWGGLFVPEEVPWEVLHEVRPEWAERHLRVIPRSSVPALWFSLWGFLCRYDRKNVFFRQRLPQKINAWIAQTGLELFPGSREKRNLDSKRPLLPANKMEVEGAGRGFLLRSFAPFYAVRDGDPRVFSLEAGTPRPILRLGRELHGPEGPRSLEIGADTYVRFQVTEGGDMPEEFSAGRAPNTPLHLNLDPERQTVWLTLEQKPPGSIPGQRSAGYVLSWDRTSGWCFRGFFAHPEASVELGCIRLPGRGETFPVLLGDESRDGRQAFRLTLDAENHEWGETTPKAIAEQVTVEMIDSWEQCYFAQEQLPPPLAGFEMRIVRQPVDDGPRVFEFLEREDNSRIDPPPGIRVWEPQEGAGDGFLTGVRVLGEDDPVETLVTPVRETRLIPSKTVPSKTVLKKTNEKAYDDD